MDPGYCWNRSFRAWSMLYVKHDRYLWLRKAMVDYGIFCYDMIRLHKHAGWYNVGGRYALGARRTVTDIRTYEHVSHWLNLLNNSLVLLLYHIIRFTLMIYFCRLHTHSTHTHIIVSSHTNLYIRWLYTHTNPWIIYITAFTIYPIVYPWCIYYIHSWGGVVSVWSVVGGHTVVRLWVRFSNQINPVDPCSSP
jgi:hypothetical protein